MSLHVSISAETLGHLGPVAITNSLLTGSIVSVLLLGFVVWFSTKIQQKKKITRLQCLVEMIIEGIYNLTSDIAGTTKAREFFPLIATAIIFILFNNWIGLLPGVGTIGITVDESSQHQESDTHDMALLPQAQAVEHQTQPNSQPLDPDSHEAPTSLESDSSLQQTSDLHQTEQEPSSSAHSDQEADSHHGPKFIPIFRAATADLNTTLALALISVALTQFYGVKYQGMAYFQKFINFKDGPIFTFVGILEIISEVAKIISFAFRLFGNIFAGEVLLAVISFLVPIIAPIPFIGMEIFVGFIQALVFGMLTLVFINMATIGHHDH